MLAYNAHQYQGTQYTNCHSYTYVKYDTYQQSTLAGTSTYYRSNTTTSGYDVNGNATSVSDTLGSSTNRMLLTNPAGQILRKTDGTGTEYFAAANGLHADSDLVAGKQLRIPNQITNLHNS